MDAYRAPGIREILGFERDRGSTGPKERIIRERFGLSAIRYQQLLNRVIDVPEALACDPVLVSRLRRLQQARRARRRGLRLGLPAASG